MSVKAQALDRTRGRHPQNLVRIRNDWTKGLACFPAERTWLPPDIRLAYNYITLVILRCLLDETVSLAEVKARLGELTALAAAGEVVVITKAPRACPCALR